MFYTKFRGSFWFKSDHMFPIVDKCPNASSWWTQPKWRLNYHFNTCDRHPFIVISRSRVHVNMRIKKSCHTYPIETNLYITIITLLERNKHKQWKQHFFMDLIILELRIQIYRNLQMIILFSGYYLVLSAAMTCGLIEMEVLRSNHLSFLDMKYVLKPPTK